MVATLVFSGLTLACSNSNTNENTNATANQNMDNTNISNISEASPTPAAGESDITTTESNGVKTQTHTFRSGPVDRVVVTTRAGKQTATVYQRDTGEQRNLPENKVAGALSATGDALAESAGFVADKSKDAATATKHGVEKGASATEQGAETVGNKAYQGGKTAVNATAEGAKVVGKKTAEGAKKVGETVKNAMP